MKNIRLGMIVAGVLVVGGTVLVSSTFAGTETSPGLHVIRHTNNGDAIGKVSRNVVPVQAQVGAEDKIVLVAPPGELPIASSKMVTSLKPFAPAEQKQRAVPTKAGKCRQRSRHSASGKSKLSGSLSMMYLVRELRTNCLFPPRRWRRTAGIFSKS